MGAGNLASATKRCPTLQIASGANRVPLPNTRMILTAPPCPRPQYQFTESSLEDEIDVLARSTTTPDRPGATMSSLLMASSRRCFTVSLACVWDMVDKKAINFGPSLSPTRPATVSLSNAAKSSVSTMTPATAHNLTSISARSIDFRISPLLRRLISVLIRSSSSNATLSRSNVSRPVDLTMKADMENQSNARDRIIIEGWLEIPSPTSKLDLSFI